MEGVGMVNPKKMGIGMIVDKSNATKEVERVLPSIPYVGKKNQKIKKDLKRWTEIRDGVEYLVENRGCGQSRSHPSFQKKVIRFSEEDFQKWEALKENHGTLPNLYWVLFKIFGFFIFCGGLGFFWSNEIGWTGIVVGFILSFIVSFLAISESLCKSYLFFEERKKEIYSKYIDLPEFEDIGDINDSNVNFIVLPKGFVLEE